MIIEMKKTAELVPYETNPRLNERAVDPVAASIRAFGFKVPIIVDAENVIVCGHTRWKAAQKLGLLEVPTICADDLTPEQINAFRLADNKVSEAAKWNEELLIGELKKCSDFDMALFGFDMDLLDRNAENIIQDETPEPPKKPRSVPGQVWQLGNHRLIVGDATDGATIEKLMDGATADLWLTDPPYNTDCEGGTKEKLKIRNDNFESREEFTNFLQKAFEIIADHLKPGGAYYVFYATANTPAFVDAIENAGFTIREFMVWVKDTFTLGRQDYQWRHEGILYGWKDGAAHYFVDDRTQTTCIEAGRNIEHMSAEDMRELLRVIYDLPSSVIRCEKPKKSILHPTMKPVQMIAKLIENSTRPGERVIDTFGGSGTTLIACEHLGRVCYTSELDPRYADVIIKRWEQLTGEDAFPL